MLVAKELGLGEEGDAATPSKTKYSGGKNTRVGQKVLSLTSKELQQQDSFS